MNGKVCYRTAGALLPAFGLATVSSSDAQAPTTDTVVGAAARLGARAPVGVPASRSRFAERSPRYGGAPFGVCQKFPTFDMLAVPPDWFNPAQSSEQTAKKLFNDISYASSMLRDAYMYRQLASAALDPAARIFAEVGRDHIPAQARP